ncbi:LysR substrate-binding domain-containing protein [Colwellia sp. MEBiC06753]
MLEIKHLRTLLSLHEQGSLTKAALALSTSQSALSHQIKELESKLAGPVYLRKSQPLTFTDNGLKIIELAKNVLPKIEQTVNQLTPEKARSNYSIGFACHACFQWVVPIIQMVEQESPTTVFDYHGEQFSDCLSLDLLFSDDKPSHCKYHYAELGQFEQVLTVNKSHPLAHHSQIIPEDLANETLLTYPLPAHQLDAFRRFLSPAKISPKHLRSVSNTLTMLQMVNANYGVAIMPNWLINNSQHSEITTISLGPKPLLKKLYIRIKPAIAHHFAIKQLIHASQQKFNQLLAS